RLRTLPSQTKSLLQDGELSMGQARTLLALKDKSLINQYATKAAKDNLTVRELEVLVNEVNESKVPKKAKEAKQEKSVFIRDIDTRLTSQFDTKVVITAKESKGKIQIEYESLEDVNNILFNQLGLKRDN